MTTRETTANFVRSEIKFIRTVYGNIPCKDADANLRIFANEEDIANAIPNDTRRCVFANSCHRLFDSTHVVFFKTRAYVDMLDENGVRTCYRYRISKEMIEALSEFDKTGEARPGGYTLYAPVGAERLDAVRQREAKRRIQHRERVNQQKRAYSARRRAAKIKGTLRREGYGKTLSNAGVPFDKEGKVYVRSGTGLAQFTHVKDSNPTTH